MFSIKKFIFVVFLNYALFSFHAFAQNNLLSQESSHIVIGDLVTEGIKIKPLILISNQFDKSWSFLQNIDFPTDAQDTYITSIQCNDHICSAIGHYNSYNYLKRSPLFLTTNDNQNWNVSNTILNMPSADYVYLQSESCEGKNCMAVGFYSYNYTTKPLVILSNDHGQSWTYQENIAELSKQGSLNFVNCIDKMCIAVGYNYSNNLISMPLILSSHDGGLNWSFADIKNLPSPTNGDYALLNKVSCTNKVCIAYSTTYISGRDYLKYHSPLLLISHDQGDSWFSVNNISDFPDNLQILGIKDVRCTTNHTCVAVGEYAPKSTFYSMGMFLISDDDGKLWRFSTKINGMPPDSSALVRSIFCENSFCLAAGNYSDKLHSYIPLILSSKDGGQSWSYIQNNFILEGNLHKLFKIYCNQNNCSAIGTYTVIYGAGPTIQDTKILILTSTDHGSTWSIVKSINNQPTVKLIDAVINDTTSN